LPGLGELALDDAQDVGEALALLARGACGADEVLHLGALLDEDGRSG
jgi:hypothetical protein